MTLFIDRTINYSKWPVAFVALFCLPVAIECFARISIMVVQDSNRLGSFLFGLLGYLVLWQFFFRTRKVGSFFSTLEHECTHAIVALLTLHGVTGMRVTWNKGGHVRYTRGEGNWLITIAPYFLPTISLIAVFLTAWIPIENTGVTQGLIGASIGFHLGSSYLETHDTQSDLIKVGYLFSCCILPTANLLMYSFLFAFVWNGQNGFVDILEYLIQRTTQQIEWAERLVVALF